MIADRLVSEISRLFWDKSAACATMMAIILPVLLGFGALGVETGIWYRLKLRNQSAADAAAISAAFQVIAGRVDIARDLLPAAAAAATDNGYNGSAPMITYPYTDYSVNTGVAITLQQAQKTIFSDLFLPAVTVSNRAVAVVEPLDRSCILALGTSSTNVEIGPSARLTMPNCAIAANSISQMAIVLDSNKSSLIAATLLTAGEVTLERILVNPAALPSEFSLSSPAWIGAPMVADPYAGSLTHAFLIADMPAVECILPAAEVTVYQTGGCVMLGLDVQSGKILDLAPGTYWVTGDLSVQSAGVLQCSTCDNVRGIGVTLILTARRGRIGALHIQPGATVRLNAPSSGPFAGVLFAQDANELPTSTTYTSDHSNITGTPGTMLNGLLYFPKSSMTFHANPSITGPKCLLLVVDWVNVDQDSFLDSSGCTSAGLVILPTIETANLAE
jgi:Flp pilus assembly protein TadG